MTERITLVGLDEVDNAALQEMFAPEVVRRGAHSPRNTLGQRLENTNSPDPHAQ